MDDNKPKHSPPPSHKSKKPFGKGSIMRLGETSTSPVTSKWFPLALWAGRRSWRRRACPRGRVVGITVRNLPARTTLILQVIAEMQKLGGMAAFIDGPEPALDPQ